MKDRVKSVSLKLLFVLAIILCARYAGFSFHVLIKRGGEFFEIFRQMFPPELSYAKSVLEPLWETVQMSVSGTALGAAAALPMAAICSTSVSKNNKLSAVFRALINILRSVPVLILALSVSFCIGTGTLAGTAAIAVYSFGILTRLTWEELDLIPTKAFDTVTASGCGRAKAFLATSLIQCMPGFAANSLYVLESNVRHAAILGYVGAGGLGILLNEKIAWREYAKVGTMLLLLYLVVFAVESFSTRWRQILLGRKEAGKNERKITGFLTAAIVLLSFSGQSTQGVSAAGMKIFRNMLKGLSRPDTAILFSATADGVFPLLLETVCMAAAGTAAGALISLPLAFLGSRNTGGKAGSIIVRFISTALRTIPAVIYGLLFIRVSGPGAFAGLLTFAMLSVGMCTKLFTAALDNMDTLPSAALQSTGCSKFAVLCHAVWPMVSPKFITNSFYRFDVNLREASVMGLVGAGGIGAPLIFAMNNYNWPKAGAYLLGLMLTVLAADFISARLRRKAAV